MSSESRCRIWLKSLLKFRAVLVLCFHVRCSSTLLQCLCRVALLSTISIAPSKLGVSYELAEDVFILLSKLWLNSTDPNPDLLGSLVTVNPWMCDEPWTLWTTDLYYLSPSVQPVTPPYPPIHSRSPRLVCKDYGKLYWKLCWSKALIWPW